MCHGSTLYQPMRLPNPSALAPKLGMHVGKKTPDLDLGKWNSSTGFQYF